MKKRFVRLQLANEGCQLMQLLKKSFLVFAGVSLVILTGCASKPPAELPEQVIVGRVPADPPKNPVIDPEGLKAESKSIAVTDIYFKKEGKNLVFIEETRQKTNNNITSTIAPKIIEVDADKADASALTGGPNSSQFPVKFTNLADPKATAPVITPVDPQTSSASSNSSDAETQTSKKSGYESKMEYGELRYLANPIRGLLIKSGYKVVQAKPTVSMPNQGDEYFDIVKRIKAGDFSDADYVLYGVLAEVSNTDNVSDIPGTKSTSHQMTFEITVDFNIVDTKTMQIVASFIASGEGKDVQIDGRDTGYKPSTAKLMKLASIDLAEDVRKNLADQNFITNNPGSAGYQRNLKRRLDDDATTLKVYK